ncbi:uncharacterized protein LOC134249548 [Saccostrea cucullata]|uniref:uncharacterized protein LOC134249548 n=1 Tax=Saccostrea cuccullata TaxID=36930 RepID=UPI002ED102C6
METVVPEYDDITFRRMFRLKRSSAEVILQKIGERLTYEEPLRGRPPLSPEKQLLIALWYLGTQSTVVVTDDRFGVTDFSFRDIKGFPDVIGALDGTNVHITPPTNHPEQYINRKGFHSLQLQWVCDSNLLFIHAYVGWPGSVHDARVLKNSDLWNSGPQLCEGKHLIADSAYPLQEWLLTPFRRVGILTREQTITLLCQLHGY